MVTATALALLSAGKYKIRPTYSPIRLGKRIEKDTPDKVALKAVMSETG